MRRLLAVLGALAMVGAAIAVRDAIDDDDGGGRGDGDGEVVVLCARDLLVACEALDGVTVRTAVAADTAAEIASGEVDEDVDAWVTTSAWTEVLATRAQGVLDDPTALGRTPAAVAIDPARAAALMDLCGADRLWACLGEHAGAEWEGLGGDALWGTLKVGLPSADSATGLAVLASIATGSFGGMDFAANDFETGDFRARLDTLAQPSGRGEADPVATLVTRRGTYSAVAALQADARRVGDRAATVAPEPRVLATAVIVRLPGGDDLPSLDAARQALREAGWSDAADEAPTILKPGVLAALHTLWTEITSR